MTNSKESKYSVHDLSERMFWDVDINGIDWEKHQAFILSRVMEYGRLSDWKMIKSVYGLKQIKDIALNLRSLDDFSISFLSTVLNVKKEAFRCYNIKQSLPNFWNY